MKKSTLLFLSLVTLGLTACDSDQDGLTNAEEEERGTDPKNADSDGDGLNDGEEIDAGTDPKNADSDGDGLNDGEEIDAGTDPLNADTDGDGVDDMDEIVFGSDPLNADSDGDGLTDGEEWELNTDPNSADTDGDGYLDPWEVAEGSNPSSSESKIYEGDWPYNPNKVDMTDPGWGTSAAVGGMLPHYMAYDQFGDMVDIYDFAYQGKPILMDRSGPWCGWCKLMSMWLDNAENNTDHEYPYGIDSYGQYWMSNFQTTDWYEPIREMVANGDIYWITIVDSGNTSSSNPTQADVDQWYEWFPHPKIPILLDSEKQMSGWYNRGSWPTVMLLNEKLEVENYSSDGYPTVLQYAYDTYGK